MLAHPEHKRDTGYQPNYPPPPPTPTLPADPSGDDQSTVQGVVATGVYRINSEQRLTFVEFEE